MITLQSLSPKEQEIWNFLHSRTVFALTDVISACSSPRWIIDQFLNAQIELGNLAIVGRLGNTRLMTVHSPKEAQIMLEATAPEDQALLWKFVCERERFLRHELLEVEGVSKIAARRFFHALNETGLIREVGKAETTPQYSVLSDHDLDQREMAQRLSKEGRIWYAIRIARRFTPLDIQVSLGQGADPIALKDIQGYCSMLARAGYLAVLKKARPGKHAAHYQLTNNTGPLPPVEKRMAVVVDPNEERIVYAPKGLL